MITKDYKLVDSNYSLAKGREVVFKLLDDKINFLKVEVLNTLLTTYKKDEHKKNRILELQNVKKELENILAGVGAGDDDVEVFCELKIKVK